jgi:hypothetical protein
LLASIGAYHLMSIRHLLLLQGGEEGGRGAASKKNPQALRPRAKSTLKMEAMNKCRRADHRRRRKIIASIVKHGQGRRKAREKSGFTGLFDLLPLADVDMYGSARPSTPAHAVCAIRLHSRLLSSQLLDHLVAT